MNEIINFIKANYKQIISVIILIAAIIISSIITVKKSGGKTSFWEALRARIFEQIPLWAELVEKPGNGEAKKEAVIELALNEAKAYLGRDLTDPEKQALISMASSHLENVLKSPKSKSKKSKYTVK